MNKNNNRFLVGLALCLSLIISHPSFSQEPETPELNEAIVWLKKLQHGLRNLNFEISLVVFKPGAESEPYLWQHGIVDGQEMEHLSLLNGPGREAFRIGQKVSYFEPGSPPYSLTSSFINGPIPLQFFRDPENLENGYDVVLVGRSRVSGLAAQQVRIISKDNNRYSFTAWLDQETGLLLKLDMLDLKGKLIEQMQVTSLQVTEEPHPYFAKIEQDKLPAVTATPAPDDSPHQWKVHWLPAGMEVLKSDVHRLATGDLVDYLLLSDGLVDVSVFMHKVANGISDSGWTRHQSTTLLSLHNGAIEVTVVGKIPAKTANAIASSIRPK